MLKRGGYAALQNGKRGHVPVQEYHLKLLECRKNRCRISRKMSECLSKSRYRDGSKNVRSAWTAVKVTELTTTNVGIVVIKYSKLSTTPIDVNHEEFFFKN